MKIFYAVQATGNGHISRAMELLPRLQQYGTVDIFLSGDNSHLSLNAPVRYRSKGISLYYNCSGGLDYWKILRGFHPFQLRKEINELPVEKYDLVINDFDYMTATACARKKIPSVQLGHQASFQSKLTPRPAQRNAMGEWLLKNYAKATHYLGLHFAAYDSFILPAVVKQSILEAGPADKNYITVYLPSYCEAQLEKIFHAFTETRFTIFSKETSQPRTSRNIRFLPVSGELFNQSLVHCTGIITGGGFETPAEALHLGKKLMCIPIRGQYEQQCNAAALKQMGVTCLKKIDDDFPAVFHQWIQAPAPPRVDYSGVVPALMDRLFSLQASMHHAEVTELLAIQEAENIPV